MKDENEQTGLLRQLRCKPIKLSFETISSFDSFESILSKHNKIETRVGNNLWIRAKPGENIGEALHKVMKLRETHPEL